MLQRSISSMFRSDIGETKMSKLIAKFKFRNDVATMADNAMALHALSDAELADRNMNRSDIAREIMVNGNWA